MNPLLTSKPAKILTLKRSTPLQDNSASCDAAVEPCLAEYAVELKWTVDEQ